MSRTRKLASVGAVAMSALLAVAPAGAVRINLTDIGGVAGSKAELGFRIAANYWESVLTNNVTVNLNVGFSSLGDGILGSTGTTLYTVPIASVYSRLATTGDSSLDRTAVANLAPMTSSGAISMVTPGYVDTVNKLGVDTSTTVFDNDGSVNNRFVALSSSNLKALGFNVAPTGGDATITFSSDFAFDFNPSDGIERTSYDFIGVAIHEIGHSLGFISGVDDYDYVGCAEGPLCDDFSDYDVNGDYWGYGLDLFRYGSAGVLDWAPGDASYFSIDGGNSNLFGSSAFSTGSFNGDGNQASHWKAPGGCTNFLGIMNPYLCNGTGDAVTALDLAAFDAIGWNTSVDVLANPNYVFTTAQAYLSAVPEPASWMMMIAGFGIIGGGLRRRRPSVTVTYA